MKLLFFLKELNFSKFLVFGTRLFNYLKVFLISIDKLLVVTVSIVYSPSDPVL